MIAGEEGLLRGPPALGVGVGEDEAPLGHDLEVDAGVGEVLALGAAHHDAAGAAGAEVERRPRAWSRASGANQRFRSSGSVQQRQTRGAGRLEQAGEHEVAVGGRGVASSMAVSSLCFGASLRRARRSPRCRPNGSVSMPQRSPQNIFSNGTTTVQPASTARFHQRSPSSTTSCRWKPCGFAHRLVRGAHVGHHQRAAVDLDLAVHEPARVVLAGHPAEVAGGEGADVEVGGLAGLAVHADVGDHARAWCGRRS